MSNDREHRAHGMKLKEMEHEMVLKQLEVNIALLGNDVTFDFAKNIRLVPHFDESYVDKCKLAAVKTN